MAVLAGTIMTRVLLVVADGEPVEVATLPTKLTAARRGSGVVLNSRRWRLSLALGFLRVAWATAIVRGRREAHSVRQKIQGRLGAAHLPRGPGSSLRR